ncbi:peptidoglycan bridge formation glycyltransferase FemA/FemB family protein [Candidatus Falkowbacteria bacterium]|nr:peptidoglycan bridge formation glycyltransferase FemA/FemB family protein [Candidatus Falkowbacteria bacterium]
MQIIQITDKNKLNDFVASQEHSQFLQSWQWGEFQKKVGAGVWRVGVEDPSTSSGEVPLAKLRAGGGELVAAATIVKKELPVGKSYFYCGRGPAIAKITSQWKSEIRNPKSEINSKSQILNSNQILELLFSEIEKLAREEGAMFLRFDPLFEINATRYTLHATLDVQPSKTLILNLNKSEDELLKEMHQKTRYNIKLAEKKGVKVIEGGKENFEDFWRLIDQTSGRDKFRPHGRNYYEAMFAPENDIVKLYFAEYQGRTLAAGIFSFFGDSVTYLHGGSANESREVMAPHLLQWHVIKFARSLEYKYFDFHGIDEEKWPGVTRFKKGFGGDELNYPGTFDLVYDEGWYGIYKMIRKVRRTF